jgi:hypothetical protein
MVVCNVSTQEVYAVNSRDRPLLRTMQNRSLNGMNEEVSKPAAWCGCHRSDFGAWPSLPRSTKEPTTRTCERLTSKRHHWTRKLLLPPTAGHASPTRPTCIITRSAVVIVAAFVQCLAAADHRGGVSVSKSQANVLRHD